jgi:hypothetical protein
MNFRERKIAYEDLKGTSHLDADRALLEKVDPTNPLLQKKVYKPETMALEILWELLGRDDVTRDMVVSNRRASTSSTTVNGEPDNGAEVKAKAKEDATIALLAAELIAMTQKELNALALVLEIDAPDRKAATLRPLLEDYRANLPKEAAGTGENMEEVPTDPQGENTIEAGSTESHSDQVIDQMNADAIAILTAEIESIKEQLKTPETLGEAQEELELRLDRLERDLEDVQEINDNLQNQVNDLADDIEAEKKSQGD